jgi:hypothetical protein
VEPMKYKDFIWPQNPKRLQVSRKRELREFSLLGGGSVVQDLGLLRRVAEGEGELWGDDCVEQFGKLWELFRQEGAGLLSLPGYDPFYAHFAALERKDEPFTGLIRYSFRFWEDGAAAPSSSSRADGSHTVSPGETLWTVAALHHTTVDALLRRNPGIIRPDRLSPGKRVMLP